MTNTDSIDIRAITIQVRSILKTDNIIQLNEVTNTFLVENMRVKNEKNLLAVRVFENYKVEKRKWREIHHELKGFQIQQAVLELRCKLTNINLKWKENQSKSKEFQIQSVVLEFRSKLTNINLKWEKADIGCKLDFQGFARNHYKTLLQFVNHTHVKNMMINSIGIHKTIMVIVFGHSKMPTEVMNTILQYTSLAFVWVNWMESQDEETLDNTSKFFKLNNIDNVNESSLRPWHVNFLNSVSSHSWSRISK
jgi:hypothetical protein